MDFVIAILFYVVILTLLLAGTWKLGIRIFSAVTVSFLIAAIFLMILVPPTDLERYTDDMIDGHEGYYNDAAVGLFCLIYLATLVLVVWYVLENAYSDRYYNDSNEYSE